MFSRHTTQQFKQAIALMLGCVVPAASWAPSLSLATINNERGYDAKRVLGASM
jgi:hypothetical protein